MAFCNNFRVLQRCSYTAQRNVAFNSIELTKRQFKPLLKNQSAVIIKQERNFSFSSPASAASKKKSEDEAVVSAPLDPEGLNLSDTCVERLKSIAEDGGYLRVMVRCSLCTLLFAYLSFLFHFNSWSFTPSWAISCFLCILVFNIFLLPCLLLIFRLVM